MGYGLLAFPAAILIKKFCYKVGGLSKRLARSKELNVSGIIIGLWPKTRSGFPSGLSLGVEDGQTTESSARDWS